jgi:hypothetical protein
MKPSGVRLRQDPPHVVDRARRHENYNDTGAFAATKKWPDGGLREKRGGAGSDVEAAAEV